MKIDIIHDWLINFGGAEKCLIEFYKMFNAPIYTLFKNQKNIDKTI